MLNRVQRFTPLQAANRALTTLYQLANDPDLPDEAGDIIIDAITQLENHVIEAPVATPADAAEKFRFLADKIDRACGGVDKDERDCVAIFTHQLATLRSKDPNNIGGVCPVWGGEAAA